MSESAFTAFRLWSADGMQVTFSFPLPCQSPGDFSDADAQAVQKAIATGVRNGFFAAEPSKLEGEKLHTVWGVIRRGKVNDDGTETAIMDFYAENEKMVYAFFKHYLNKPEDVTAFEAATGMKINEIPLFDGSAALEKTAGTFGKYIRLAPNKPRVALTPNPYYDANEQDKTKKKPQFKFGRWLASGETDPKQNSSNQGNPAGTGSTGQNAPTGNSGTAGGAGSNNSNAGAGAASGGRVHWADIPDNKLAVANKFKEYGITGRDALLKALDDTESGLKLLVNSKADTVQTFLGWIDQVYGKQSDPVDDIPF